METLFSYWLKAAAPPVFLAVCVWLIRNVFLINIPENLTLPDLMRLEIITGGFALVLGVSIAILLGLSMLGLGAFEYKCFYHPLALPSVFLVCAMISYRTIPITGGTLWDCLILAFLEVWVGMTAYGGFVFLVQVPQILGTGPFFVFITLGVLLGLIIRILISYLRGV